MNRLQFIEKQNAQFAHVLGVTLIVFQAPREAACSDEKLPRCCIVAMRLLARESLARTFLKQSFANADARNREGAKVKIPAQRDKGDRRDAHDVGAVSAHGIRLHALSNIAAQDVIETLAQQRQLQSW